MLRIHSEESKFKSSILKKHHAWNSQLEPNKRHTTPSNSNRTVNFTNLGQKVKTVMLNLATFKANALFWVFHDICAIDLFMNNIDFCKIKEAHLRQVLHKGSL